ncbi:MULTISPECIES: restriction endonuclease subunit S [unclassified Clostridium]|uniref:restriction endonuclease subunit S n=1 Tax=unclassified Clostridium TaxID=2614128 RepID=UPI0002972A87|nr:MULTISPECIES: restriction endonuclease subunit S [unclassified Clostridium]EKQ52680.1 MAG: restriction endonuclease S subunit [Clostridium sp. Maddingley MBC34-26]
MNMILEQFKTIFDRPEKVKKLREVILDLAVRGKLVEQNPSDEPASVLLERIRDEKDRLVKEGKIKKEKPLAEIGDEEKPYELPRGWEWIRLGEYSIINPRNSADDDLLASFIPMKLINDGFDNRHGYEKKQWKEIKSGFTHFADNDVVVAKITPCFENRKSAIIKNLINGIGAGTTELYVIRSISGMISQEFVLLICKTEKFITGGIETYTGTAGQQRVKKDYISNLVVGVPPLEEQKHIVEKVNSLMLFCDKLEKSLEKKVKYGSLSAKSVFNSVSRVNSIEELEESLKFIIANFKDLTLGDNAVKELKTAILQLAVQGKLVPQNPEDEPASVLLERIQEEKERLIKEKKIKREKPFAEMREEEKLYELPRGWEWSKIGNITTIVRGSSPRPKGSPLYWSEERTEYHWITISDITQKSIGNRLMDTAEFLTEKGSKLSRYVENGEIIIAVSGSTVGKATILNIDGYIYDGLAAFKNVANSTLRDYLFTFLQAWKTAINAQSEGSAFPNINTDKLNNLIIAIPPLAEQRRIVEKVDSLMQLCNELEKKIEKSKKHSEKLMESILKSSFLA